MKTIITILILIFVLSAINANAQLKYGPVVGVNFASVTGKKSDEAFMRTGFHLGMNVQIPVSEKFKIAPGLLYSLKGARSEVDVNHIINLSYIELPVNAKFVTSSGLNFFAGPYLGILLSAKTEVDSEEIDLKSRMTSSDFGMNFGIGYDSPSGIGVSAQYGVGFSNLNSDTRVSNSNSVVGVSLRYWFE
jgi:hypothetical protein